MTVIVPFSLVKGKLTFDNVIDSITVIFALERSDFFNEFVDQHSKRPEINPLIVASSGEHLRGTIIGGSSHGEHFFAGAAFKTFAATSKVDQNGLPFLFIIQNVLRLDVPMANVSLVDVF
jgi:hypothetical protein